MPAKVAIGTKGVVSDHQLATQVGLDVLKNGGNAFDAAIAISAVLSVVQPQMGGIGGDAFLLGFYGDEVIAYLSSGKSPSGFREEDYLSMKPTRGPLTVTIPGLVYLWGAIHEEFATLPLDYLLRPAINIAYNGFNVGLMLSEASSAYEKELEGYKWSKYYRGLNVGDTFINRDMARALRLIASRGWEEFYYGELAENITSELEEQGVVMGLDDLMEHEGSKAKPLKLEWGDALLYELPPNTQGITTLQLISALQELELGKHDFYSPERITSWSEPIARTYKFRDLYIGDPDYMSINPEDYVKYSSIENVKLDVPTEGQGGGDTTFFIVSDGDTIIGFIQSIFYPFGSGLTISGFPVQNRAVGFAKVRGLPNSPAPRKLPLHTLSVLGVDRGNEKYIIGCVGGDARPQLQLRVFENIFVYGMPINKAVAAPRFIYVTPYGGQEVVVERPLRPPPQGEGDRVSVKEVDYFEAKGHVHVGKLVKQKVILTCDPRSEGLPLAFG